MPLLFVDVVNFSLHTEMFPTSGGSTSEVVDKVGDWKEFFGTERSENDQDRKMFHFTGLGTVTIDGIKRRVHSFKIVLNSKGKAVLYYKENDENNPWISHWNGTASLVLEIFKQGSIIHVPIHEKQLVTNISLCFQGQKFCQSWRTYLLSAQHLLQTGSKFN
jgi:hypothetical protein